jgi:CRP-like cAMP-binding protein
MPDEVIIKESEEGKGLYLISQGECIAKIDDEVDKDRFFKL